MLKCISMHNLIKNYRLVQEVKGVKKVRSAIKMCSSYFSQYASNDINNTEIHLSLHT